MPLGVVTVIKITSGEWIGLIAVIELSEFTVKLASVSPKRTDVAPVNPLPMMETVVPPAEGPTKGATLVTTGDPNKALKHSIQKQTKMV